MKHRDDLDSAQMLAQARSLHEQGQLADAQERYEQILIHDPRNFDTLNLLGVLSGQTGRLVQAVAYFDRAIAVAPANPAAHCNRGLALRALGQHVTALASLNRAIELNDQDASYFYCRAGILLDLNRPDDALIDFDRSIACNASFAAAFLGRGNLLQHLQRPEAALASFDAAIALDGAGAEAHIQRGHVLYMLNRLDESVASYERSIAFRPDPAAHVHLGNAHKGLGRRSLALQCYEAAIGLNPSYAEAHANLGVILYELGRIDDALRSYDRAIEIKPDYAEVFFNRGSVLRAAQQFEAAAADFAIAATLRPGMAFLQGALLEAKLQICDWVGLEIGMQRLTIAIEHGEPAAHPFAVLTLSGDAQLQRRASELFARLTFPANDSLAGIAKPDTSEKIKIGYFSADFREHPVSRLMVELIDQHDRRRFEVIGFSFGPDTQDELRSRLRNSFDRFIDVHTQSDRDVAILARQLDLDIAVDLGGYTLNSRTGIFALRAAPIQVNYLGYLGTLGSEYMDYLIADDVLIPPEYRPFYTEKAMYLPSFQANDTRRRMSERVFTRAELGLPPQGFVFCCLNSTYKIMPDVFATWMKVLKRVPDSSLFLNADNPTAQINLSKAADDCGVNPARLVFGTRLGISDYLARYRAMDLFLDTLPYNAGTTASDALWTGLPVLTCTRSSFSSRMAASLLKAIDLPELITSSAREYEDLATDLASNPQRLAEIRRRLERNRHSALLFDSHRFVRHLESAYRVAYDRYRAGLPPDHIRISPLPC